MILKYYNWEKEEKYNKIYWFETPESLFLLSFALPKTYMIDSLLATPYTPIVNPKMWSTVRFHDLNSLHSS